ncbi:MAG: carboxypeptidase-like regulatory domain-containing protein, partial [Gemmatimonadaceae bacterium]
MDRRHTFRALLAFALACGLARSSTAQSSPGKSRDTSPAASKPYASARGPQYLPLESVRSGAVRMPKELAHRVSLTLEKAPLQRVLMEIATQAGLGLSYGEELVRDAPMVSINITGKSAADALASAVEGTKWTVFVTANGQVTVGPADIPLLGIVTGVVTDKATAQPVSEAQVSIDGTRLGTTTNSDGRYTITAVPVGPQRITVRRIGYEAASSAVMIADGESNTVS